MPRVYATDDTIIVLPLKMRVVPIASVLLASLIASLPWGASAPLCPPMGLMFLTSWRLRRPGIWPIWIGLPLGLIDDIASGQPIGSAVALWTITLLALEAIDRRILWRDFWLDWGLVAAALLFGLVGGALLAEAGTLLEIARLIVPQLVWSVMLVPMTMRIVAALDGWRKA